MNTIPPTRTASVVLASVFILGACATNPVTGRRELALVSEGQEIEMGREGAASVSQSIGYVPDAALQAYVTGIGKSMAARSERPNLPWEFHVVDDASINAFAMPGGFIFVTRGILAHMENEAELASVLGHEIGHVTARHTVQQISRAQLAQIGLGVGSILSPTIAKYGEVAGAGMGLLFLKFGRDDEIQADDLGFRYALTGGYDVREMASMFRMLQRQQELAGVGRLPEWQSTHPDPGNRIQQTEHRLESVTENLATKKVGTDEFIQKLNNLVFGENPRLGYFEGTLFLHPDLKFRLQFPSGWKTQNQADAVVGLSAAQDALIELRLAQGSAADVAQKFFNQQGLQAGTVSRGTIQGLTAITGDFAAQTEQGALRGLAGFIEYGGRTYQILAYTPSAKFGTYSSEFQRSITSFGPLTDSRALNVQPARVRIERVPRAMTLTQFNDQYPSGITLQQLALINAVETNAQLPAGKLMKRVVK